MAASGGKVPYIFREMVTKMILQQHARLALVWPDPSRDITTAILTIYYILVLGKTKAYFHSQRKQHLWDVLASIFSEVLAT